MTKAEKDRVTDLMIVLNEYRVKELRIYKALTGNPEGLDLPELQKIARPGAGITAELIEGAKS